MEWIYLTLALPVIGAIVLAGTRRENLAALISGSVTTAVFVLNLVLFGQAQNGMGPLDSLSAVFGVLSALVWWATAIYAPIYMHHEERPLSFYVFFLLTLSAVQGIFFAQNLINVLVFFEIMTVTSFFWVIHRRDTESLRAGYFYLFLGVLAGLLVAVGIVLLSVAGNSLNIGIESAHPGNAILSAVGIGLMIAGFGVKAGMVPLHIWLPMAHPVAPTPGSALLSGILIKCGAYGLIRVAEIAGWGHHPALHWMSSLLTAAGIATMLVGVVLALLQSNAKRLLAYHSVSQMGYIILGLGIGLFLHEEGVLGAAGAVFHSINHALFKSALFLAVGVIYIRTGELDLYRLGGLWRRFPWTALFTLIAAMGITGTPGLNGYASKTILHHAVSEAAHSGVPLMVWAEWFFLVVGVGTTASFVKLFYLAFLAKPHGDLRVEGKGENFLLSTALGLLSAVMLVVGIWPRLVVEHVVAPAVSAVGMGHLDHLMHVDFWNVHDLQGMAVTLSLGILVCWLGLKTGVFHWHPPVWLSLESLGRVVLALLCGLGRKLEQVYLYGAVALNRRLTRLYHQLIVLSRRLDSEGGGVFAIVNFSNLNFDAVLVLVVLAALLIYYFELEAAGIVF